MGYGVRQQDLSTDISSKQGAVQVDVEPVCINGTQLRASDHEFNIQRPRHSV
jgi:hypothetical protein